MFKEKLFQWNWIPEPDIRKNLKPVFLRCSLKKSTVKLKSYSLEDVPVIGQMEMLVKYNQQEETLPLLVVKKDGCSLFGRN